jgi:hypothetical protein
MFTKSKMALSLAVVLGASVPLASAISSAAHAQGATKDLGGVIVRPSPNVSPEPERVRPSAPPATTGQGETKDYGGVIVRPSPNVSPEPERGRSSAPTGSTGGGETKDYGGVIVRPSPNVGPDK